MAFELPMLNNENNMISGNADAKITANNDDSWYNKASTWIHENPDQLSIALGRGAQAVMGPYQNSWQALMGGATADWAQSSIAAKEAKRQEEMRKSASDEYRQLIEEYLKTGKTTPPGEAGATKIIRTQNPDGSFEFKLIGDTGKKKEELGELGGLSDTNSVFSKNKVPMFTSIGLKTGKKVIIYSDGSKSYAE